MLSIGVSFPWVLETQNILTFSQRIPTIYSFIKIMNSLPSETTRDIASTKVTYVNDTTVCQIEGKDEMQSQSKQGKESSGLDNRQLEMQPKQHLGKKRTTFAHTTVEITQSAAGARLLTQSDASDLLRTPIDNRDMLRSSVTNEKIADVPPIRRIKKARMSGSQMMNIRAQVITKHRRSNAYISLEDVLSKIYERKGPVLRKASPASIQE